MNPAHACSCHGAKAATPVTEDNASPSTRAICALELYQRAPHYGLRHALCRAGLHDVAEAAEVNPTSALQWLRQVASRT